MRLSGKSAIVTGAARGIGSTYARALAAEGANVTVADVLEEEGAALASELETRHGRRSLFVRVDVTDEASVNRMAQQVEERFGRIDILVNNAAVYQDLGKKMPFDEITIDEWDRVMAVNVRDVWQCTRAVAPYMRRQEYGKIVNVASVVAFSGSVGFAHYVASKGAVIGLTRALARELGPSNITVNAVAPGLVANEASRQLNADDYLERGAQTRSIKRLMAPDDLVGAVIFLSAPDSDFMTGQTLVVDGGGILH